jgi:alkylation response protein AidB-like acyl-CoA dehydrogenase
LSFTVTETQVAVKDAARRYLTDQYTPSKIARLAERGQGDLDTWAELRRQGWLDAGLGIAELTMIAEESGRALNPAPWLLTAALALPVYAAAGTDQPGPATLVDAVATCRCRREDDIWLLDGTVPDVTGARDAAEIIIAADTAEGAALFGIRPDAPGAVRTQRDVIDPLRDSSDFALAAAPARLLAGPGQASRLLAAAQARLEVMLAAEAVGVADRVLEFAVEHAKSRVQFGRPIGAFQAIAHPLADSYADVELARSLTYHAAHAVADGDQDQAVALAAAAYASRRAAVRGGELALQVCGGMGITWEFPLHWWYRRALWLEALRLSRPGPLDIIATAVLGEER